MPNIDKLKESRFLTKEECGAGILVTVEDCIETNMALEGQPQEMKWTLHFAEAHVKPMVLNSTNGQIIAGFMGSKETDDWRGRKIVLYNDPSITFAGKLTGGIRARAPRLAPASPPARTSAPPPPPRAPETLEDENVPY